MEQSTTGQSSSARVDTYIYMYNAHSAAVAPLYKRTYNRVKLKRTFTPHVSNHKGIEVSKTKLGVDHPDTLTNMANLASTYRDQGRWANVEALDVQVMEASETKLGADHPDTLTSTNKLAFTFEGRGKTSEAIRLMRDYTLRVNSLGIQHPCTVSSCKTLTR